jgi:hypothetical protein
LCEAVIEATPRVTGLNDAVLASVAAHGEDRLARTVARMTRRSWSKTWRAALARSTDRSSALTRFLTAWPAAMETVLAAQTARADRDRGQELTLGWMLTLMSNFQLATEHLGEGDWLIVDEGFSQRAVAVFGFRFAADDQGMLDRYLNAVPLPRTLVVVDTPVEECARRLDERGWSERVVDLDAARRLEFLESCREVIVTVAKHREQAGSRVIWVDGTTPTPDSILRIGATLAP